MKIIYNNILPPKGYKEITLLCFVFAHKGTKVTDVDMRHESIHWEQEKELLIVGFYLLYVLFFVVNLVRYRNWHKAYRMIPYEREAYFNQPVEEYLKSRQPFSWVKYL